MKQKRNTQKGITLIALIITIIILLILAMVSIRLVMNQGILDKAKESTSDYKKAEEKEQIALAYQEYQMAKMQREENPSLTVPGATVTGNETEGWEITFEGTGNTYTLKADGGIELDGDMTQEIKFTIDGHEFSCKQGSTFRDCKDNINFEIFNNDLEIQHGFEHVLGDLPSIEVLDEDYIKIYCFAMVWDIDELIGEENSFYLSRF